VSKVEGVLLTVGYDGKAFSGFVRQTNARTVAGELEGAIRVIDPRASFVRGASRTDAGVHALAQAVSFDSERVLSARSWVLALSGELPDEIAIVRAARVPVGYDPRHHALRKTYRYVVLQSPTRDPFLHGRAWRLHDRLNHQLLRDELEALLGEHDFGAFRSAADERSDTVRTMLRAELRMNAADARCAEIIIEGNRFMHNMVRIIAGTVIDVARGRLAPGAVRRALSSKLRGDLGMTAPAAGLYLDEIVLRESGEAAWPESPASTLTRVAGLT
jgi:tRNA pseudouridine38-40 synthase